MKEVLAEIIAIGDELLYGQTLDTNSHWISQELDRVGVKVVRRTTVGDREDRILAALAEAESRADLILITGGLGPTSDDLTKPCLARYFNSPVRMNQQALAELEALMRTRGRELNELTRQQAALPEICEMISNPVGTAPGMWFDVRGKVFVSMPGVPHEMKTMMRERILPRMVEKFKPPVIVHKIIRTCGLGESWLAERIAPWERALPSNARLAYLPTFGDIKLRITLTGPEEAPLRQQADELVRALLPLAQPYIYGFDDDTLESVVGQLLRTRRKTLSIAESCTGGHVSQLITSVPGSSDYFRGAIVAYHNDVKMGQLGIPEALLAQHGAVSEEVAIALAQSVREMLKSDFGLATTGIAGPGGGTPEKPVGTVWIACSDSLTAVARRLQLLKDRQANIRFTGVAALDLLRQRMIAAG
jgi:nicotinamide-nucleotide amidase